MHRYVAWLVFLLVPASVHAGVNIRNGNFYISYSLDSICNDLSRTYNSKSITRGWFGFGWGSLFETRLMVMTDGSAVMLENGSGATTFYGRRKGSAVAQGIEQIILNVRATKKLDADEVDALRKKLADEEERITLVKKYGMSGEMADGTTLVIDNCDKASLARRGDLYVRTSCAGDIETFNSRGWLLKREESGGGAFEIKYDTSPYPFQITTPKGCTHALEWDNAGMVMKQRVTRDEAWEASTFFYEGRGNLVRHDMVGGNRYLYSYDANHNMTEIGYLDNSKMSITYDERQFASSVTDRDGSKTRYEYGGDTTGPFSTIVTNLSAAGEALQRREYRWDREYRPLRGYESDGGWIEYEYHSTNNKISRVHTANTDHIFEYDAHALLVHVLDKGTMGQVWIRYDSKERISQIEQRAGPKAPRKVLQFEYNAAGKPTLIKIVGAQSIRVQYDAAGEIASIASQNGTKAALAVTQAFQSFLQLVKVTGTNVSF